MLTDFGDLNQARRARSGLSSSTRGVFAGGITIRCIKWIRVYNNASQGNAIDYGDLVSSNNKECDSTSNSVRGIVGGGYDGSQKMLFNNLISQLVELTDFGDLTFATNLTGHSNSNSHGGLNDGYSGTNKISNKSRHKVQEEHFYKVTHRSLGSSNSRTLDIH